MPGDSLQPDLSRLRRGELIDANLQTSIMAKVNAALGSTDREQVCTSIEQLDALINQIDALRGKKISDEAADELVEFTNAQRQLWLGQGFPFFVRSASSS